MALKKSSLRKLTVPQLKSIIRKYEIGTMSGNKAELIARIIQSPLWEAVSVNESVPTKGKRKFTQKQLDSQRRFAEAMKLRREEKRTELDTGDYDVEEPRIIRVRRQEYKRPVKKESKKPKTKEEKKIIKVKEQSLREVKEEIRSDYELYLEKKRKEMKVKREETKVQTRPMKQPERQERTNEEEEDEKMEVLEFFETLRMPELEPGSDDEFEERHILTVVELEEMEEVTGIDLSEEIERQRIKEEGIPEQPFLIPIDFGLLKDEPIKSEDDDEDDDDEDDDTEPDTEPEDNMTEAEAMELIKERNRRRIQKYKLKRQQDMITEDILTGKLDPIADIKIISKARETECGFFSTDPKCFKKGMQRHDIVFINILGLGKIRVDGKQLGDPTAYGQPALTKTEKAMISVAKTLNPLTVLQEDHPINILRRWMGITF
tara:strand:- start:1601 stop:2899 length:1299 start_codon:yes stop_codon:yes gene_type:complete